MQGLYYVGQTFDGADLWYFIICSIIAFIITFEAVIILKELILREWAKAVDLKVWGVSVQGISEEMKWKKVKNKNEIKSKWPENYKKTDTISLLGQDSASVDLVLSENKSWLTSAV